MLEPELTERALHLLQSIFAENSNIQLPAGLAKEILEIKDWVAEQLKIVEKNKF